ncbi:MAG: 1-acyl-sn-glycerol-3-phosphate acyltransferase, partial [Planctomycetes bacterium]|nr:1-acyl-sn-glycerol-3-phosphate acyltransferase [Planctomycetota bacterium]
ALGGKRRVWTAAAEDYFFDTAPKRMLFGRMLDTIPFDRRSDGILGLRRCGEALRRGDGLLMFPEGTRSTTGELQPFKVGIAILAIEHEVPIIPVYIDRAFDLMPKGRRFIKPGALRVTFGEPIEAPDLSDRGARQAGRAEVARELTERVEAAVAAMSGETAK